MIALAAAAALAGDAFVVDPGVDGPLIVGPSAIGWLSFLGKGRLSVPTGLADPEAPGGLDTLGTTEPNLVVSLVSDGLLYGSLLAAPIVVGVNGRKDDPWGREAILVEAFALNMMTTEIIKLAVDRPRPYTLVDGVDDPEDLMSFPSGHSSTVAALWFATARLADDGRKGEEGRGGRRAIVYGTASALTLATMACRVEGAWHWPTDVTAGALLGGSIGFLVPELHASDRVRISFASPPGMAHGATVLVRF